MKILFWVITLVFLFVLPSFAVVTDTTYTQSYSCSGSTSSFSFPFAVYDTSNVVVHVVTGTVINTLTPITAYSVILPTYQPGGTVTLASPALCPNGSTLNIIRQTPETQTTSYKNNQYLNQSILMKDLDKIWMFIQETTGAAGSCDSVCQAAIVAAVTAILNAGATAEPIVGVDATSGNQTVTLPTSGVITYCKVDSTANTVTLSPVSGQYIYLAPLSVQMECAKIALIGSTWYKQ